MLVFSQRGSFYDATHSQLTNHNEEIITSSIFKTLIKVACQNDSGGSYLSEEEEELCGHSF